MKLKQTIIKTCGFCGSEFEKTNGNQKYCSPECAKLARNQQMREWYRRHYEKLSEKRYPCSGYAYYKVPVEICLNCNLKRCKDG